MTVMLEDVLVAAGAVIVFAGALGVLVKLVTWTGRIIHRVQDFLDDWNGEPARPGSIRRPGVPERLGVIEGRLGRVEAQMKPNGGTSLRDAVDRIDTAVAGDQP